MRYNLSGIYAVYPIPFGNRATDEYQRCDRKACEHVQQSITRPYETPVINVIIIIMILISWIDWEKEHLPSGTLRRNSQASSNFSSSSTRMRWNWIPNELGNMRDANKAWTIVLAVHKTMRLVIMPSYI
jgi:hypothetical protein